jgi:galactonate dehydratase
VSRPSITRVETAAVRVVGPCLIVRLWAGDTHGLGECYPSAPVAAVDSIVRALTEQLVGEDPRDVHRLAEKLRRWNIFTGGQAGTVTTAISGLELALWDLAGKLHGVPVYQLLGGAFRTRVRLYADCNAGTVDAAAHHLTELPDPTTDEGRAHLKTVADKALGRGFTALKFDVDDVFGSLRVDDWNRALSHRQIDRMVGQVGAIRDAVGPDIDLAIDMHARFDVPSAIRAARALEPFDLMWLEEPVPPENLEALAEVRRATTVPICAGENLYTRFPFLDLFRAQAVDVVMPDVAKFGGLAEGRRVAELAELHYLPFAPHNVSGPVGTVAAAHLCAAVSNFTVLEYHALDLDFFDDLARYAGGPVVADGHVQLTEAPGFGIEVDEDALRSHEHGRSGVGVFAR